MEIDYSVGVLGYDGNKVLWKVVDNHAVEETKENDEIGLWGFDFNLFDKDKEGGRAEGIREVLSKYYCLSMLMNLWTVDWKNNMGRKK